MPFCPECRRAYPDGVVLCRDCRVELVDSLDGLADAHADADADADVHEGGEPHSEWVSLTPLRDVPDPVIAAMWKGALESQGLHPVVRSRALPGYGQVLQDWGTRAWGELLVPADELEEARAVLIDFIAAAANSPLAEDEEP
jgi:hypothetical protein